MKEQTRYRLTGAIFLLSIGIIVLPMLFDGEGVRVKQLPELTESLPPMPTQSEIDALQIPQAEVRQHEAEQELTNGLLDKDGFLASDGTRIGDPSLRPVDEDQAVPDQVPAQVPAQVSAEDAPKPLASVERLTTEAVESNVAGATRAIPGASDTLAVTPDSTAPPARRAPPVTEKSSAQLSASSSLAKQSIWAVQLASFSSPVNASALRDRLLGDGFQAWTSTARADSGIRTRVAIGPLLDRGDAERMRDLVSGRYKLSAIIVHMEP